jgi:hypothetical protein
MILPADMNPMPFVVLGGGAVCAGIALSVAVVLGGVFLIRRERRAAGNDPTHPKEQP